MARFTLTNEFTVLTGLTDGTLQNVSRSVPIEVSTSTTKNTGIVLNPGDKIQFTSENALYARAAWENPAPTETVYLAHEPFKGAAEGGDSPSDARKPSTPYSSGALVDGNGLAPGLALRCTTPGTTGAEPLDCSSYDLGDTITDGTVTWLVVQYAVSTGDAFYIGLDGNWVPTSDAVFYSSYWAEGADGNLYPLEGGN